MIERCLSSCYLNRRVYHQQHCIPEASGTLCQFPLPPKIAKNKYYCKVSNGILGPCLNGQECDGIGLRCECDSPFYGEYCEFSTQANCSDVELEWDGGNKTLPDSHNCQNGGFCDYTLDHPICRCKSPYRGDFCEFGPATLSNGTGLF